MAPAHSGELQVTDPQGKASTLPLAPGDYLLGRADDCDIRFPASAKTVSRHHARLRVSDDGFVIEDLESRTGLMVNGQVVRRQRLEHGDVVSLANWSLRLHLPHQAPAATGDKAGVSLAGASRPSDEAVDALDARLQRLQDATRRLMTMLSRRIVGQEPVLRAMWAAILAKGHCLMIGVPGLAKTFMVTSYAECLGLQSARIQFTPDLMPADIIGGNVLQEGEDGRRRFEFIQGPVFTQLLLADEINRTPPKTQAALLEAMQERQVTVANRTLSLPSPFCVIASQNPIEQEGTYPLPEAQQDRFMLCLLLDYPEREQEIEVLLRTTTGAPADLQAVLTLEEILGFQGLVDRIAVSREAATYAADLARATRPGRPGVPAFVTELVDWGAGPRAGQALLRAAKAAAAMDGRPAIALADLRDMAHPVLRHRLACNYKARAQGLNADALITRILESVKPT